MSGSNRRPSSSCYIFSLDDIKTATNDFANKNSLGEGGFGKVYRGNIAGQPVAVKRMTSISEEGIMSFHKEIDLLTACDQVNIISLVGYCDEKDDKILVYEFMPKGSLYDYLYEHKDRTPRLTVEQRLEICLGVAQGLSYLHFGIDFNIIHSDLKTDNILLDDDLVPKIADFGLSRTRDAGPSASQQVTNNVKGTPNYIAPECYEPDYKVSRKADVYAFGVILLEVLCERPSWKRLVQLALPYVMRGELEMFTPEYVESNISPECVRACENLIRDCLENDADKRPMIDEVVDRLQVAIKLQNQSANDPQTVGTELALTIPEGFHDRVVLYHTSNGVIVKTQDVCQEVRKILDGYGKRVDERDLYLDSSYKKQLKAIFGSGSYTLPQLFISGKYIGGADEIRKIHWSGALRKKLDRLPKRDYPSSCRTCMNTRFASLSMCPDCCYWKRDQANMA
ncbi:hypothetical protein R6Q59_003170 [Mikania micrantha]